MRKAWPWLATCLVIYLLWLLLPAPGARSSTLSRGLDGWWGLRAYLEARGVEVSLLDAPLAEASPEVDLLVLALPWQRPASFELGPDLRRYLGTGGGLLVAYDGDSTAPSQQRLLNVLGLDPADEARTPPPLGPRAWWAYRGETWTLTPETEREIGLELEIPAFRWAPRAPEDAHILYSVPPPGEASGRAAHIPVLFTVQRHGAEVTVMPASVLANGAIRQAGNADLVEWLVARHGTRWAFDEYHHGLMRPDLLERSPASHAWDLFVLHLGVLYLLALFAAGRRFGPAWHEAAAQVGSTTDFLRNLGALHHQLGHHRAAAEQLVERSRRLRPDFKPPAPGADGVTDGPSLVELAARLDESPIHPPPPPRPRSLA